MINHQSIKAFGLLLASACVSPIASASDWEINQGEIAFVTPNSPVCPSMGDLNTFIRETSMSRQNHDDVGIHNEAARAVANGCFIPTPSNVLVIGMDTKWPLTFARIRLAIAGHAGQAVWIEQSNLAAPRAK